MVILLNDLHSSFQYIILNDTIQASRISADKVLVLICVCWCPAVIIVPVLIIRPRFHTEALRKWFAMPVNFA